MLKRPLSFVILSALKSSAHALPGRPRAIRRQLLNWHVVMECVTSPIGTQQMNLIQKTIWSTLSNMKAAQLRKRRGKHLSQTQTGKKLLLHQASVA